MVKLCIHVIFPHSSALINAFFFYAQFPTSWKNSHIRALLQSITPFSPYYTRLTSFLPKMTKIQERLADDQLLSNLIDRYQTVIDDNSNFRSWFRVFAGVPWGSVLGPLLFALFINDPPDVFISSNHMIYSDDTQIYYHCFPSEIHHGIAAMQREAQAVADWVKLNGLEINFKKSKVTLLGKRTSLPLHTEKSNTFLNRSLFPWFPSFLPKIPFHLP